MSTEYTNFNEYDGYNDYNGYSGYDPTPEPSTGFHPVNIGHLVMGVAFAVMVTVWALVVSDVVQPRDLDWLMPVPWLAAGAAGLAALLLRRSPAGE